jgi:hypothetical protein
MKTVLLIFLSIFIMSYNNKIIDINIERRIINKGFHKILETKFDFKNFSSKECKINIQENITSDLYIDHDEIKSIIRYNNIKFSNKKNYEIMLLNGDIEVEKPAWKSKKYLIQFIFDFPKKKFSFPIHFRYQKPSYDVLYTNVMIYSPYKMWLTCNNNKIFELKYNEMNLIERIPVGNLKDIDIVNIFTIFLSIFSVIIISFIIIKK